MLEDWQHRLPEEARALIPADKLIAVELVANISPETTKKDKASMSTTAGKRKNKKPRKVNFHFGEDVPEELHEGAAEWKQCVEKGGEQFFGAGEPAESLKDLEKQVSLHGVEYEATALYCSFLFSFCCVYLDQGDYSFICVLR